MTKGGRNIKCEDLTPSTCSCVVTNNNQEKAKADLVNLTPLKLLQSNEKNHIIIDKMTMKRKLSLFLILYLIINLNVRTAAQESPDSTGTDKKQPQPISITMFIPGIQQMKSGKFVKGTLLLGAFIGCITGTIIHNNKGNDWYKKYLNSTNVEEIIWLRQKTEKSFKKRNLFIVGILSVWALHVIDLKFSKNKKGSVKGEVGNNRFNIGFYYTF